MCTNPNFKELINLSFLENAQDLNISSSDFAKYGKQRDSTR
jgi:hypothetical protein